jgi:hypothetical protein
MISLGNEPSVQVIELSPRKSSVSGNFRINRKETQHFFLAVRGSGTETYGQLKVLWHTSIHSVLPARDFEQTHVWRCGHWGLGAGLVLLKHIYDKIP